MESRIFSVVDLASDFGSLPSRENIPAYVDRSSDLDKKAAAGRCCSLCSARLGLKLYPHIGSVRSNQIGLERASTLERADLRFVCSGTGEREREGERRKERGN